MLAYLHPDAIAATVAIGASSLVWPVGCAGGAWHVDL
jgi:hypothetical protein